MQLFLWTTSRNASCAWFLEISKPPTSAFLFARFETLQVFQCSSEVFNIWKAFQRNLLLRARFWPRTRCLMVFGAPGKNFANSFSRLCILAGINCHFTEIRQQLVNQALNLLASSIGRPPRIVRPWQKKACRHLQRKSKQTLNKENYKQKCETKRFECFGYQSQGRVHERSLLVVGRLVVFVAMEVRLTLRDFWEAMHAELILILLLQGIALRLFLQESTVVSGCGWDFRIAILCPGIDPIKTGPGKSSKVKTSCVRKSSIF